jgi:hypothetical protein
MPKGTFMKLDWKNLGYGVWRADTESVIFQIVTYTLFDNNVGPTDSHRADRAEIFLSLGEAKATGERWAAEITKGN